MGRRRPPAPRGLNRAQVKPISRPGSSRHLPRTPWTALSGRGVRPADGRGMDNGSWRCWVLGVLLLAIAGCAAEPVRPAPLDRQTAPGGTVEVTIQNGVMRTELDRRHEVDQLVAAAEAALRARGFTVDGSSGRLEEPLKVTAHMGGTYGSRRAEVAMLIGPTRVRFDVAIRPWGNDAESRAVMKRMLELLGYAG